MASNNDPLVTICVACSFPEQRRDSKQLPSATPCSGVLYATLSGGLFWFTKKRSRLEALFRRKRVELRWVKSPWMGLPLFFARERDLHSMSSLSVNADRKLAAPAQVAECPNASRSGERISASNRQISRCVLKGEPWPNSRRQASSIRSNREPQPPQNVAPSQHLWNAFHQ